MVALALGEARSPWWFGPSTTVALIYSRSTRLSMPNTDDAAFCFLIAEA
jgi:hypothetical protein